MIRLLIKSSFVLGLVFTLSNSFSQSRYLDERYIFTQHFINPILVNAGSTGMHGGHQILVNYRNNWSSFPGSPKTITLSYDGEVADRLGFGAMFLQDTYGALRISKGQISFAYQIKSDVNQLGMGISTEYISHGITGGLNGIDPTDAEVIRRLNGTQFFDLSFGLFGMYDDKLSYGVAVPSLISSSISDDKTQDRELGFIFNVGYKIHSQTTGINIEPSLFVKQLNTVPTHVDLNLKLGFLEDKFSGGVTYTIGADKRLGFLLGAAIDKLDLFYSYNISTHQFQEFNNGAHEITLRLKLGNGMPSKPMMTKDSM